MTHCDDNEQGKPSDTTYEDDDGRITFKSEVELAVKNGKAT